MVPRATPPPENPKNNVALVEQFRKLQPPTFEGELDPLVAEDWISSIERIFNLINYPDARKVACATFMLQHGARHWWDSTSRSRPQGHMWTWEEFKELFLKKYYPANIRNQKETEFIVLKQGSMTLVEYKRKFDELSQFALELVDTEKKQARRFEQGLRDDLR
ncbi:uncharacterized protein LOC127791561 [Diospyros lotus]|uniref:uncharacterized protein LOC127791561 n=1 Tax=Diospyros lotus TaxID=55363 RepID=UPI00224F452B|nr:uncharacterized protein LOC127791561 [Diospyros lotus]